MQLSSYISDLLFEHDCVTVPEFGSFLGNYKPAQFDLNEEKFTPPSKQLSFNSQIRENDGLLAKHISKKLNITYDEAVKKIHQKVIGWTIQIKSETIVLKNLGEIFLSNEDKIVFSPSNSINHLKDSFGLSPVFARQIKTEKALKIPTSNNSKPLSSFYKKAAIWTLLIIGLGSAIYTNQRTVFMDNQVAFEQESRKQTIDKAQKAIFNLGNLPTLTINVKMKQKKYYIIAGAFRISQNAENLTATLKRKGYDASILGLNEKGLNPVSFSSFNNRTDAVTQLRIIQRKENKDAWIFESY
ncbi:MAG: sporulation protein [Flavobacteriaceae bacterium]|nr:sporulation protein [Flavobacteriaceae bacterium]|tara:strand:+ start:6352 stop:7248 length:897 start_codon:yes stop_codon:yes gene_type:complete